MLELFLTLGPLLLAATALLATPWGLPVLSWLIGNPIGRVIAVVGIALLGLWLVFLAGRNDGVKRVHLEQQAKNLEALRKRVQVDEEIRTMPADKRREELRKWVR